MKSFKQVSFAGKRVVMRADFNVPIVQSEITDGFRIRACLPTIRAILQQKPKSLVILSHLGRPQSKFGRNVYSLSPVSRRLCQVLSEYVPLVNNWPHNSDDDQLQGIALAENIRFLDGELENSSELVDKICDQCDVYVMEAFACAHRKHASTYGVLQKAKEVCTGLLFEQELAKITSLLHVNVKPYVALLGGSKIRDKIGLIESVWNRVDTLILGGGIANTMLKAQGYEIGKSIYCESELDFARSFLQKAEKSKKRLIIPTDVVTAKEINLEVKGENKNIADVQPDDYILDIGANSLREIAPHIEQARYVIWNGPFGLTEFPEFRKGSSKIVDMFVATYAYSVVGGGDTVYLIDPSDYENIDYCSTGGGAFLSFLQHETLPSIEAMSERVEHEAD